ncbi:hypothetical protein B4U80_07139 [Leptotrombidium deliense]|uniref:Pyroglutamyl-peptidase 1-like protein n=1 Tax=Leptotrombidium deliense TaxID=299467 RepID=A0A443SUP6_9ACAR|nr:hypothetical protein B4U80_07139 [Leptotrombidium deliense]
MDEMKKEKPTVLLTGFGPFRDYKVNSSWEAVKLVHMDNVNLVKEEIPVVYNYVDEFIPKLWQKHKPTVNIRFAFSFHCRRRIAIDAQTLLSLFANSVMHHCSISVE